MTPSSQPLCGSLSEWTPVASGQARLKLNWDSPPRKPALEMQFDFNGGGGYVVARRAVKLMMPEDYIVRFKLRGIGPVNNLEIKFVDSTGLNVWRHVFKDLRPSRRWSGRKVESRDMEFAWGPAGAGAIGEIGAIEIALVAGEGGAGTIWIADIQVEDQTPAETPRAKASSERPEFPAAQALGEGWKPDRDDPCPWIEFDMIGLRTIGGLIIGWFGAAPATGFRLRGSGTGRRWRTLHSAPRAGGNRSYVYLPDTKIRFLRLELNERSLGATLRLQSFEYSRSIDAFWHHIAAAEARGWHPRWLQREQSQWTPIGTSHGKHCALMNEDGMVEIDQGSMSIEPMLWIDGHLMTWADNTARQELPRRWVPCPTVVWETAQWRLHTQAETTENGTLRVRYRFDNLSANALSATLFVVFRPFQVTPPWQRFGALGGVSRIHDLAWRNGAVLINETMSVVPRTAAGGFGTMAFDQGFIAKFLASGQLPKDSQTHDPTGFASGALAFALTPLAHASVENVVACNTDIAASDGSAFDWPAKIPERQFSGADWAGDAIGALLTAASHILVTRSGPALQPGPRRYTRSWIRDGTMMSAALLRMRCTAEVREFIIWYRAYQRADGFVPCLVDHDGPDWLVEHDSHAQLIALIADFHRFSSDESTVRDCWKFVERAAGYIERTLDETGLMPISVSHEGYLAQPVHSYWDDFWTLRGLHDGVYLAQLLGHTKLQERWGALALRFANSMFASIEATRAQHRLDFIPGSVEWADFDPTATSNAIALLDIPAGLNRAAVERTFDAYLDDWRRKRSGALPSPSYTPYEIRIIGALVRLDRRDAALELLRFFLSDRRPLPWNQWPEIAWRDRRAPAHVGDLPHTWVAAEYVLAVRSLFAYEREADQSIVIAAGLAPEWIAGAGVRVDAMPTIYGTLSYTLRQSEPGSIKFTIDSACQATLVLRPPLSGAIRQVSVDGASSSKFDSESVTVRGARIEVICTIDCA